MLEWNGGMVECIVSRLIRELDKDRARGEDEKDSRKEGQRKMR